MLLPTELASETAQLAGLNHTAHLTSGPRFKSHLDPEFSESFNDLVYNDVSNHCNCSVVITHYVIPLLQVHPVNVLEPVLMWEEFLNEELNNRVNMALDYRFYSDHDPFTNERHFSFLEHPFILNTANKVEKLLRDNLLSHFSERQRTYVHSFLTGVRDTPFLHLHISREDIVSDTLSQVSQSAGVWHCIPLCDSDIYICIWFSSWRPFQK